MYVSATPGDYERERSGQIVEQVIRPTGLLDPKIEVRPVEGQIDDLIGEINARTARSERVLVTTLTKKMAEDLTTYLTNAGIKVRYMHHDIDTIERMEIIRDLRLGTFDVLVGINLLREGLDLPEVSLVAILDADKEASSGRRPPSSRPSAGPPATPTAWWSCTPTPSPPPCAGPSTRPSAAGPSRTPSTGSTASCPRRSSSPSAT